MSKLPLILFIFLLFSLYGKAQEENIFYKIDSLTEVMNTPKTSVEKTILLQELSNTWLLIDTVGTNAKKYAEEIFSLNETNNNFISGVAYYQLGNVDWEYIGLDSAEVQYKKAINFLKKDSSDLGKQYLARAWHNYGLIQQLRGDNETFLDILLHNSIPILEQIQNTVLLAGQYHSVGIIFDNIQQYDKSKEYYLKTVALLKEERDSEVLCDSYIYLAKNLLYTVDPIQYDGSEISDYLNKAHYILSNIPNSSSWVDYYIWNGVFMYHIKNDIEEALKNYDQGLQHVRRIDDFLKKGEILNRKYYLYYDSKQFEKARQMALEQYELVSSQSINKNKLVALRNLIHAEEKLGNISRAYELLNQWVSLSDSIEQSDTKVRMVELEKKYNEEKQERQILQLQDETNQKEIKLQRSRIWTYSIGGISILMLIVIVGGYTLYHNKQQIAAQKEQLHIQEKEQLRQEQKLSNYAAMLEGQESERKRIASELHDSLGGTLSGIKLKLSQIQPQTQSEEGLHQILSQLDNSVNELRRIARNLMPESLIRYDLPTALEEFCRQMENKSTKIVFQALGDIHKPITQTSKITLYRIVQELVANALKHADASMILVQIAIDEYRINLTIEDNGKGFDTNYIMEKHGLGYTTLRNRVEYLNGKLEIDSNLGIGTTVHIKLLKNSIST